ncbi:hypothetical protein L3X38_007485 [Prunus dulcis]|uniref:Uncharacterized protein n=1 Tax=Prunus dulcis TaxID=3755 RepID=A0AAD5F674_PRUDU|nr:hypothetical protein L3X38_007485 [Prunus dulcis]
MECLRLGKFDVPPKKKPQSKLQNDQVQRTRLKRVGDDGVNSSNYVRQQVKRAHDVTKPPTEASNNIFDEGDSTTKYELYNGGIEVGFEMFRKYAQLVDGGSTKWDKIQVYEAIAILEKRAP